MQEVKKKIIMIVVKNLTIIKIEIFQVFLKEMQIMRIKIELIKIF
jgi:hypothetical protein